MSYRLKVVGPCGVFTLLILISVFGSGISKCTDRNVVTHHHHLQEEAFHLVWRSLGADKTKEEFNKLEKEYETEQFIGARCKVRMSLLTKFLSFYTIM